MFDYAVGNWVVVTHGNQRFSGFTEDKAVEILHSLPCKQKVLQKKLIKLPFLIVKWTSFLSVLRIFVLIVFSSFEKINWTIYSFISYSFILGKKILNFFLVGSLLPLYTRREDGLLENSPWIGRDLLKVQDRKYFKKVGYLERWVSYSSANYLIFNCANLFKF